MEFQMLHVKRVTACHLSEDGRFLTPYKCDSRSLMYNSLQSMGCRLWTGSSINGILQARIVQWVAIPFSRGSSWLRDRSHIPALQADSLPSEPPGNPVQFSSVAQSYLTLCDTMNRSTPDLPVRHQLLESTQTHVHWVSDAIQPSHSLSSPSPPALNLSQHEGLFLWVSSSHQVARVLEFQLQHQSYQWIPRTDLL